MVNLPAYTVVIPAYNAADTIEEAVISVLTQSVPPTALIVIDDGSTDATADVVDAIAGPIRLIRQANAGPGAATSRGMREVDTPIIGMLDADDLWLPGKAERQLAALAADPTLGAVFCRHELFGDTGQPSRNGRVADSWTRNAIMLRMSVARQVGDIIDPPGFAGDVVDWLARMREQGHRLLMLPEVLTLRRIRPGSLGHSRAGERNAGYLHVVRQAMLRRRKLDQ